MVIGITGNFGVGKTTVSKMFHRLGARIIDADEIGHTIIQPGSVVYKQIIIAFGKGVLWGSYISRKRLAREVFFNKLKLKRLNKIMHPRILKIIRGIITEVSGRRVLIIDAALLIELGLSSRQLLKQRGLNPNWRGGMLSWIDKLIVVKCEPKIQIRRLKKGGLTNDEVNRRLNVQLSQNDKIKLADFVIDNSGRKSQTQKQVRSIWNKIATTESRIKELK